MSGSITPDHAQRLDGLREQWGSMAGRRVLVTGATRGIGLETAVRLAELGAEVLVHGREEGRVAAALAAVHAASTSAAAATAAVATTGSPGSPDRGAPAAYVSDLSSLAGVRDLAARVSADYPSLDVLVANAGVFAGDRQETADGLELSFAVNAVAPIVLAGALAPALCAAAPARAVIVSSASHWTGDIHWDDLQLAAPGSFTGLCAYDQSKLAVLMLSLALARRLEDDGVTVAALDPGNVATSLLAGGWPALPGIPIEYGAVTSVYLASAPAATASGVYYEGGAPVAPLAAALDRDAQERLWAAVEEIAGPLLQ